MVVLEVTVDRLKRQADLGHIEATEGRQMAALLPRAGTST